VDQVKGHKAACKRSLNFCTLLIEHDLYSHQISLLVKLSGCSQSIKIHLDSNGVIPKIMLWQRGQIMCTIYGSGRRSDAIENGVCIVYLLVGWALRTGRYPKLFSRYNSKQASRDVSILVNC
jgi:hypothetical protein